MALGKIIAAILAVIVFLVAWRLLDIFLGVTFGIGLWFVKIFLFLVLLFVVYRLFIARHPAPVIRR